MNFLSIDESIRFKKVEHDLELCYSWDDINSLLQKHARLFPRTVRSLGNGGFTVGQVKDLPLVETIVKNIQKIIPTYYARCGLYVSLKDDSMSFDTHIDEGQHLWVWQLLGTTPWQVDYIDIVMQPNDMLYIAPGVPHKAVPNSPRASITFSLEKYE